jgi:GTPase Era involved in 16S rRNA processing
MSFFQSEIVQTEMKEIAELQDEIYKNVFTFSSMDRNGKLKHIEMLEELLKKQQVLYTRLSLSDDPEAKYMKDTIMVSARQLGFPEDVDLSYIFSNMCHIIDNMKKSLDAS